MGCGIINKCCFCIPAGPGMLVAAILFVTLWIPAVIVFWSVHFSPHKAHLELGDIIEKDLFKKWAGCFLFWVSVLNYFFYRKPNQIEFEFN